MSKEKYSINKNIKYMAEVFYKPNSLIKELVAEVNLLYYIILPFVLFTVGYEILYIRAYLISEPLIPMPLLLPLSENEYRLFEVFFFPLIHIGCFFIAMLVIYGFSKIYKKDEIDTVKIIYFFGLVGSTIGLVALILDIFSYIIPCEFCAYIHPICGLVYGIFLVYFMHEQSGIKKSKATLITITSLVAFFTFRMLFIR